MSLTGLQEPGTSSSALSLLNSHLVWVVVNTWPEAQAHFPLLEMNWLRLAQAGPGRWGPWWRVSGVCLRVQGLPRPRPLCP